VFQRVPVAEQQNSTNNTTHYCCSGFSTSYSASSKACSICGSPMVNAQLSVYQAFFTTGATLPQGAGHT
jgi:hypothetical protein